MRERPSYGTESLVLSRGKKKLGHVRGLLNDLVHLTETTRPFGTKVKSPAARWWVWSNARTVSGATKLWCIDPMYMRSGARQVATSCCESKAGARVTGGFGCGSSPPEVVGRPSGDTRAG